jgi:hypothetical protein
VNFDLITGVLIQTAPFIAIIIVEMMGTSFLDRWDSKFKQYDDVMFVQKESKKQFDSLAEYVYAYENTIQHIDLTLIALSAIFVGRMISEIGAQQRNVVAIFFIAIILIIIAIRYHVESHFEDMSPDKYAVESSLLGIEFGTVLVVLSNLLVIFIIVTIEVVPLLASYLL